MDEKGQKLLKALAGIIGSWRGPIPIRFHRSFADEPFGRCDYCRRLLLVPGTGYTINKYYVQGELNQETAHCRACRQKLRGGYSEESLKSQRRMWSGIATMERLDISSDPGIDRASILTSRCILCGLPKEEAEVHCEYAYCEGHEVVYYVHPMMVCGGCLLRLFNALSEKTRDHRRRYFEGHYGLPPDLLSYQPIDVPIHFVLA